MKNRTLCDVYCEVGWSAYDEAVYCEVGGQLLHED